MKYVAFFRGINVGGKHIVKMSDLSQLFMGLGFDEVKTYIQSGNVIFTSDRKQHVLVSLIEQAFEKQFGFQSAVVIRSAVEIKEIVDSLPFSVDEIAHAKKENPDVEHIYIYLTNTVLDAETVSRLSASYSGKDTYHIAHRELYLLCYQSISTSQLSVLFMKSSLSLTARNLKTMKKISSLF